MKGKKDNLEETREEIDEVPELDVEEPVSMPGSCSGSGMCVKRGRR